MGRNTQLSLEDDKGVQIAVYKVPYGAKLYIDNNEEVKKGKKIKRNQKIILRLS